MLRDWLADELDLAGGETVHLRRSDVEIMRSGLTRCAVRLDNLTVDPAQLLQPDGPSSDAALFGANSGLRTLQ